MTMPWGRRRFVQLGFACLAATRTSLAGNDPFDPTVVSLSRHSAPDWFRDAKFGVSAHWTPQSVPEQGDWYARNLYVQGSAQYEHHVAHYGHPSQVGYKDLCRVWKADRWDPEGLMELYRKAGARYFVALANHHDGFDCWDSTYQPWNSMHFGPKADIVGTWARIARKHGVRFGVSTFSPQNWKWFNVSHGSDKTGPLAGVPYDGNLTKADGKGQWWDGYDPQQLYCRPHADDEAAPADYIRNFVDRTHELIDRYRPDLVFFTDRGLPFGQTGMELAAYFYNASARWHQGQAEAVINTKNVPPNLRKALVWDRLPNDEIGREPWQMDICIGDWHYKQGIRYKTAANVVPYLVDVVSKNGNLLLNLPVRANGTLDEQEIAIAEDIAAWMRINGEAIFGTRPWETFGEGPARSPQVDFPYNNVQYTAKDVRFTAKGTALYAFVLAWPEDGRVRIQSLGREAPYSTGEISNVELLGSGAKLEWRRENDALVVLLPKEPPCRYVCALRIARR